MLSFRKRADRSSGPCGVSMPTPRWRRTAPTRWITCCSYRPGAKASAASRLAIPGCRIGTPPATPTDTATAARPPRRCSALATPTSRRPPPLAMKMLSSNHKSSSLAEIAELLHQALTSSDWRSTLCRRPLAGSGVTHRVRKQNCAVGRRPAPRLSLLRETSRLASAGRVACGVAGRRRL